MGQNLPIGKPPQTNDHSQWRGEKKGNAGGTRTTPKCFKREDREGTRGPDQKVCSGPEKNAEGGRSSTKIERGGKKRRKFKEGLTNQGSFRGGKEFDWSQKITVISPPRRKTPGEGPKGKRFTFLWWEWGEKGGFEKGKLNRQRRTKISGGEGNPGEKGEPPGKKKGVQRRPLRA